ncbi:MAG: NAD-dependent epimerase/dehydratase family protein [Bacteroidetes bacterium]|nr:MAG: NAD-dependent epimerase/dehydratase family protein [Bacteroidota bacterium]TAG90075.1 MAG: NAD-dependent epimerase/dehydratase family protein [Bacteroidota bacterium]
MPTETILITGALGQIGTELSTHLADVYGKQNIILTDLRQPENFETDLTFESLNVMDAKKLGILVDKYKVTQIYHLAAVLSASGEQDPLFAWQINMEGVLNVLGVGKEKNLNKIYYPSTIAVFGLDTPKTNTPQNTIMNPNTVYGISKLAGERWAEYYFKKYNLDVRSLRYPGIISYKTPPGGGTTDYAIDIFYHAAEEKKYECFLTENTQLPMMYMPDAIRATLELMESPAENIKVRSAYNLSAISFSPKEVTKAIQTHIPNFKVSYKPDFRQAIADSWPMSIDSSVATRDWGWNFEYTLEKMTEDMLVNLKNKVDFDNI